MDVVKMVKELVEVVPEELRLIFGHALSMGLYTVVYVFLSSLGQDWQVSLALTAGVRAGLKVFVDMLPLPKDTKAGKTCCKASRFMF